MKDKEGMSSCQMKTQRRKETAETDEHKKPTSGNFSQAELECCLFKQSTRRPTELNLLVKL